MSTPVLEMRNIVKSYFGVTVLEDVGFTLEKGQILGLVGENGAGKSTLMKVLSGGIQPDSGEIYIDGERVTINNPIDAKKHHISIVHQELSLITTLSVTDNMVLGTENKSGPLKVLNAKANREYAQKALDLMNLKISPDERVSNLPVADQQLVEIARCLITNPKVLILDEPTTALTLIEAEDLLKRMEELRDQGTSIIFISHKLEEIARVSDKMLILRDGNKVAEVDGGEFEREDIIKAMVGDKQFFSVEHRTLDEINKLPIMLDVKNITQKGLFEDVSFSVHKGEVFGFFGLKGAGRSETLQAIFGADRIDSGEVIIDGESYIPKSPRAAIEKGIGFVTEDRKFSGILPTMDIKNNIMVSDLGSVAAGGVISEGKMANISDDLVDKLKIKIAGLDQHVNNLSGGNQQKVMIARWLHTDNKILVFDEPTKGVDVGAKQDIYQEIHQLSQQGKAIIVISSELEEVMLLSDRVAVMREGKILDILDGDNINAEAIMQHAAG